jgi:hypothetical protein
MLESGWGFLSNTWWGHRIQRVRKPFPKSTQTSAKSHKTNQTNKGYNPWVELCPKNKNKNGRKIWGFGGDWVFDEKEKKWGNRDQWWRYSGAVEVRWKCDGGGR